MYNDSVTEFNFWGTLMEKLGDINRSSSLKIRSNGGGNKQFKPDSRNFDVSFIMGKYLVQIGVREGSQLSIYVGYKNEYGRYSGFFLIQLDADSVQKPIGRFKQINAFLRDVLGAQLVEKYGNHACYQAFITTSIKYVFANTAYQFNIEFKTTQRTYERKLYRLSKHAADDINERGKKHHYLEEFKFKLFSPVQQRMTCMAFNTVQDLVEAMKKGLLI